MDTTHQYFLIIFLSTLTVLSYAQQTYLNNKQLNCTDNSLFTQGFQCTSSSSSNFSCLSYATFRTTTVYNTPTAVASLLATSPSSISLLNNISSLSSPLRPNTLLIVPLPKCSCVDLKERLKKQDSSFYQHSASYTIKSRSETYFTVANLTYQGLSTCQALITRNTVDPLQLLVGDNISVPIRCACPSRNQTGEGFRYLLSYIVTWGETFEAIADMFGADEASILAANELKEGSTIFPFTPLLVPLRSQPVIRASFVPPPAPSPPNVTTVTVGDKNSKKSSQKGLFIGVGAGVGILFLFALFVFVFCLFRKKHKVEKPEEFVIPPEGLLSVSSETVRCAVGSLTVYNFEDLEKATNFFDEGSRIEGSVYRGSFKGDEAAVKIVRGDVSEEINILKLINHSNIVRLSGFCVHDGNTYLVYEYALNGSLSDWLSSKDEKMKSDSLHVLGWTHRVQIAHDVAGALNYLHNYTNPPYVHKNLKSSNILLDGEFRAKVSNFGLARSLGEDEDGQMTRHVVGTHGYMAPEYIENGLISPKLDVYSFGVVLLEILSGKEAASKVEILSVTIFEVLSGDNVRGKLEEFVDPSLGSEYPFHLAFSLAQLAEKCVAKDLNSRPSVAEVFMTLSKILSSSLDWDPSEEVDDNSRSLSCGR